MANKVSYPKITGLDSKDLDYLNREFGYKVESILGYGNFGTVVSSRYVDPAGVNQTGDYAIKVITSKALKRACGLNHRPRDLAISLLVQNEHCVSVQNIIKRPGVTFVIMDLCRNGSLSKYLSEHPGTLDPELVRVWAVQIAQAILYLHRDLHLAHRNINLGNILLDQHNRAMLAGYTYLKINPYGSIVSHTRCGSGPYRAPEVFYGSQHCAKKADVWAFGISIYALLTRKFLCTEIESTNPTLLLKRIDQLLVAAPKKVLVKALDPKPVARFSIQQLVQLEWLKEASPSN